MFKKLSPAQITGNKGEDLALHFLQSQGLLLITRQYRVLMGEIDLIMKDKQMLVFIEVRYRKNADFGQPFESITMSKRKKLVRTASYFLKCHPNLADYSCRFDVVSILESQATPKITWIPNAFGVE
ncbi:MAG: YraN family protein [Proteobacteria bacterium]|nr:YraN family protein [Pseudomonadota bacterium]